MSWEGTAPNDGYDSVLMIAFARPCVVTISAAVVVLMVACGGKTIDQACADYFDRQVDWSKRCTPYPIDSTQRSAYVSACVGVDTAPGSDNAATQLEACPLDCDGPVCVIHGTRGPNAPCAVGPQCQSGFCQTQPSTDTELPCGTCMVLGKAGEGCDPNFCEVGLYCDAASKTCMPEIAQGQSCSTAQATCQAGLYCDDSTKICTTIPTQGQACTSTCAWPEHCGSNGVCADPVGVGGACPTGGECAANLVCDQQTCVALPISKVGGPCQPAQVAVCDTGLICTVGTCEAPKPLGAACTVGKNECAVDLSCISGTCQTPSYASCN
jgi:hypothetical protein